MQCFWCATCVVHTPHCEQHILGTRYLFEGWTPRREGAALRGWVRQIGLNGSRGGSSILGVKRRKKKPRNPRNDPPPNSGSPGPLPTHPGVKGSKVTHPSLGRRALFQGQICINICELSEDQRSCSHRTSDMQTLGHFYVGPCNCVHTVTTANG